MQKGLSPSIALLGSVVFSVIEGAEAEGGPLPRGLTRDLHRAADEPEDGAPLLLVPPQSADLTFVAHRSHRSHSSHYSSRSSHSNHYSGTTRWAPVPPPAAAPPPAPPRPPRPAHVSLVAYPGGRIIVDGRVVGQDSTGVLTLTPGAHQVRVENAYAGDTTTTITLTEGQTGVVTIEW